MRPSPLLNVVSRATPNLTNLRRQLQHSATAGRDMDTSEKTQNKKVALYDPSVAPQKTFAHVLIGKPVPTFPGHPLAAQRQRARLMDVLRNASWLIAV
jgi:hypothetical protein